MGFNIRVRWVGDSSVKSFSPEEAMKRGTQRKDPKPSTISGSTIPGRFLLYSPRLPQEEDCCLCNPLPLILFLRQPRWIKQKSALDCRTRNGLGFRDLTQTS